MTLRNHENPLRDHFRQTGKFKPIGELHRPCLEQTLRPSFRVNLIHVQPLSIIRGERQLPSQCRMWRLYFEESTFTFSKEALTKIVMKCFEIMTTDNQLQQNTDVDIFSNVNGVLIERLRGCLDQYITSNLDHHCLFVALKVEESRQGSVQRLDCYQVETSKAIREEKEFVQEIYIKMKEELVLFYLVSKGTSLSIIKEKYREGPKLELTDHNLEESATDISQNMLIIKNLSPRIISVKFLEQNVSKCTDPIQIIINDRDIYQFVLYRINRIKYQRLRAEDNDKKLWRSFDQKLEFTNRKENKTTPEKIKHMKATKNSNESTNFVEEECQVFQGTRINRGNIMNQPKHLKISQRVIRNPKESNLVPSQSDRPASLKGENDKEGDFLDDFETLMFEEEGVDDQQLALNDSFEEFEKKENSVKDIEILAELNRRKEKEHEEKKMLVMLREKVGELIIEEKQLISSNLNLKIEIKKMSRSEGNVEQNRELEEMMIKMNELRRYERSLMEDLSTIKTENNIEVLVFGGPKPAKSTESQRSSKKIFNSINGFPTIKFSEHLTTSIRSVNGDTTTKSIASLSPQNSTKLIHTPLSNTKQSYIPQTSNTNQPHTQKDKEPQFHGIYASMPATQSFIHPSANKNIKNMGKKLAGPLTSSNTYIGFQSAGSSSKHLPDGTGSCLGVPSKGMVHQNSDNKMKIPFMQCTKE